MTRYRRRYGWDKDLRPYPHKKALSPVLRALQTIAGWTWIIGCAAVMFAAFYVGTLLALLVWGD